MYPHPIAQSRSWRISKTQGELTIYLKSYLLACSRHIRSHIREKRIIPTWIARPGFPLLKRCKFGNYLRIRGGSRKLNANGRTLFANGVRRSVMLFEWLSPSMGLTTFLTMTRFG